MNYGQLAIGRLIAFGGAMIIWIFLYTILTGKPNFSPRTNSEVPQKITATPPLEPDLDQSPWQVISVHDGDTIKVRRGVKGSRGVEEKKIRFACIDAPELAQPLGKESRDYLRSLLAREGNQVKLNIITTDRYGRAIAEVWSGAELVQSLMASKGMAYPYEQYKRDCPSWSAVQSTASQALAESAGVWGGEYEKPWEYRKRSRSR